MQDGTIYPQIADNRDALYTMLLTAGYLKSVEATSANGRQWCKLQIPNFEVRSLFDREIIQSMSRKQGESIAYEMLEEMVAGQADLFEADLARILRETVSAHDTAHMESFYHGLMLGLSVLLADSYIVESNHESGYGRFDIALLPKNKKNSGIIMELKATKNIDELEASAKKGLQQIEDKAYLTEFAKHGIKDIWKYGIAFCGKHVKLIKG